MLFACSTSSAQSLDEAHSACLRAVDYWGCISNYGRVPINPPTFSSSAEAERCIQRGNVEYCLAQKGKDLHGMPKPVGWIYRVEPSGEIVYEQPPRKVNVRGAYGRYIEVTSMIRYYSEGSLPSRSTSVEIAKASANCTGTSNYQSRANLPSFYSGYSSYPYSTRIDVQTDGKHQIDCTYNPATTIDFPGSKGELPGVKQIIYMNIVDCKDKTMEQYARFGSAPMRRSSKWIAVSSRHPLIAQRMNDVCDKVETLPRSKFMKYAG